MAFTLKDRSRLDHRGHGQAGVVEEYAVVSASADNATTSYEMPTTMRSVKNVLITANGTSTLPYVNELSNVTSEGHIKANGTSYTLTWATAPKTTDFFVRALGH